MYYLSEKFLAIIFVTCVLSYLYSIVIIFIFRSIGGFDKSLNKLQTAHAHSTPRFGGLAILLGIISVELLFGGYFRIWFLWAILPIFLAGLLEDFYIETRPLIRLLVGSFSSIIAIYLSKMWISNVDFPLFDLFLENTFFGMAFTIFACVGMINAINLIDGIHGLAAAKTVLISIGIFLVASKVGEQGIAAMGMLVAAASLGLFFAGYPFGKIFMGDAGAYTLGFIIAWQMIILLTRNPELSAWSLLAIVFWPVMDTLFSIFRRISSGNSTNKPDLLHYHQLVMRFIEIISRKKISRSVSNPLATALIVPLSFFPIILGIKFCFSEKIGILIISSSSFLYIFSYYSILFILKKQKLRTKITSIFIGFYTKIQIKISK